MGAKCEEVPYICVTLTKGLSAEPRYTLTPDVNDPVLTACTERLDCIGKLMILNTMLFIINESILLFSLL